MVTALRRHWRAFVASAQTFVSEVLERAGIIAMSILPGLLHVLEHLPQYCVFAVLALHLLLIVADMLITACLTLASHLLTLSWGIVMLLRYFVGRPLPPGTRKAAQAAARLEVCEDHFAR